MYKPIEDYGLIGNMRSAALVAVDGSIDWYCFPHFNSPSIFGAILDEHKGGLFKIGPADSNVNSQQSYCPETNVLVTRFVSPDGEAELTDFMPVAEQEPDKFKYWLIRVVTGIRGTMKFHVTCRPAFNYGRDGFETTVNSNGAAFCSPNLNMELCTSEPLVQVPNGVSCDFTVNEGNCAVFVFRSSEKSGNCSPCPSVEDTHKLLTNTIGFWRKWLSSCQYRGRWRNMVERSALVLKLLTFDPTGAMVAAPTTSLPEEPGGSENWDYRYTWLRDATFCVYAFIRLGFYQESVHFMQWLSDRCTDLAPGTSLAVMYTVDGNRELTEETLDHLEGYQRSHPVRIGNAAHSQFQLDIYGEIMDVAFLHDKFASPVADQLWIHLRRVADQVCEHWREPDYGIWEIRAQPQHYVFSKIMCWVALDRAIRLAERRELPADLTKWYRVRGEIYEEVIRRGWSSKLGAFTQYYGSETLDAANLIIPLVLFMSPNDPRFLSTLDAIRQPLSDGGLASDGLLYRYDVRTVDDALPRQPGQEGTFNMCSFWLVEALARAGRTDRARLEEARLLFEQLLTHSNHLGLYAERTGIQGEASGNFPQAITHFALISAAYNLDISLSKVAG